MTTNYIPLDKDKHAGLKMNLNHGFKFAENTHLSAATMREYAQVAGCMPIVFIKGPNNDTYHTIAMLGLEPNSNLYFHEGKWQGHVMPLNIQRFPFDVRPDGDKLGVFIDDQSELLVEDGEPLFTDAGEPTEFLKNRQQLLADIANSEMATQRFIKKLEELELLESLNVVVVYADGQQRNVTGVFTINEKKLNELSDEVTLDLKKTGYLPAIYSILVSLTQMNRLVQLSQNTANPIRSIQMGLASAQAEAANG